LLRIYDRTQTHHSRYESSGRVIGPTQETSTWQHTKLTRDKHPCPGGIRIRNPSRRAAEDPCLRSLGHPNRDLVEF